MKERIRAIMETKGMTQQEFSQFLEMSPASLSSIFTGRTNPTLNVVESIKRKFDKINLEWLMFGNGSMFLTDEDPGKSDFNDQEAHSDLEDNGSQFPTSDSLETLASKSESADNFRNTTIRDNGRTPNSIHSNPSFTDMKIINNKVRKIKEIRVFYDDQTYESFVPKE